jgi:hypothetical protein
VRPGGRGSAQAEGPLERHDRSRRADGAVAVIGKRYSEHQGSPAQTYDIGELIQMHADIAP